MNGFNLNATILNVLAKFCFRYAGGTLSYVTVLSMDGTVRFQELKWENFISGTVEYYGTTQTVKVVVIMIFQVHRESIQWQVILMSLTH
jgi:hypothetical protein